MGWWSYGLFSGDSVCDWKSDHLGDLSELIDKIIEKGRVEIEDGMRGYDIEDVPGMIFVYAELSKNFTYRTGKLHKYAKWCKNYKAEGWKSSAQREEIVHQLGEEIEALFQEEKKGYNFNFEKIKRIENLVGKEVYHLTKKENLNAILKEGLKIQECYAGFLPNRTGIYVSSSLFGCLKWQYHVLSFRLIPEPAIIKFVISSEDEIYPDWRVDFKDDFVLTNNIEPNRLFAFS